MTGLRIHDLRRTVGTVQADPGASLLVIGRALGRHDQRATPINTEPATSPSWVRSMRCRGLASQPG